MSHFDEFDVPEANEKKNVDKQSSAEKAPTPRKESLPTARGRTKPSYSMGRFISRVLQPLLTLAGAWYVYVWFWVDGKSFDDDGAMITLAVAALVALNVVGFVGRVFGSFFRYLRHLASVALLGYIIYLVLQQMGVF